MPVNPLTLTTELDAVNLMLGAISESPVETLETATHADAAAALTILRFWNITLQEEGWKFNTRGPKVLLTRDGSNHLVVPANTLNIDTSYTSADIDVSYTQGKLFDVENDTFVWTKDLYVTFTFALDFADIPQAARNAILQHAGLEFVGDRTSDVGMARFTESRLAIARSNLRRTEGRIKDNNMLTGSWHGMKAMMGRQRFTP